MQLTHKAPAFTPLWARSSSSRVLSPLDVPWQESDTSSQTISFACGSLQTLLLRLDAHFFLFVGFGCPAYWKFSPENVSFQYRSFEFSLENVSADNWLMLAKVVSDSLNVSWMGGPCPTKGDPPLSSGGHLALFYCPLVWEAWLKWSQGECPFNILLFTIFFLWKF